MSIRSALQIGRALPPAGNQNLDLVLKAGNTANQQDILGVGNLVCVTINGDPIGGSQGLADVLGVSTVGGQKDIQDVDEITCNKLVELGRSKYFEYIDDDTFTVNSASAFQIDISGGQITLVEGSYVFNFTINLSASLAVNSYTIQLDLDGTILGQTTVQAPNPVTADLTTLIINSLPVTRVLPAAGVVTLKCIVNAPVYPLNVTLQGTPTSLFSYLSWVEVYVGAVPPPIGYPFIATGTQPLQIDISGNEYIYYMKTPGQTTLTPKYPFTLDEIFVVGGGQNGGTPVGGNGGGVVSYLTPSIPVTTANFFTISVAKDGGNSTASVDGTAIVLNSSIGSSVALGGAANTPGNNGTLYATTGLTYGGSGAGGGYSPAGFAEEGQNGGVGGGGGSGQYTIDDYGPDGGNGGGNGIDAGGAGGNKGENGTSSQYGGGGGGGGGGSNAPITSGGNGGTYGGIGGSGAELVGGGGGGGGNLGGGGGGGASGAYTNPGGGGSGGAGIVIIKLTLI